MALAPLKETLDNILDTSASKNAPQVVSTSDMTTTESTEESNADSSSDTSLEDREPGTVLPAEILAILSVLLGDSISDLTPEQLENIAADFGERLVKLLSVAAVIMKVPLADQNPVYQEIISQFNNES